MTLREKVLLYSHKGDRKCYKKKDSTKELAEPGAVKNIELSRKLNVSESTIRRDINELDELGELKKVFGGAVGIKKHVNTREEDIVTKAAVHVEEKDIIAKYAAGFICDDDSVFIDAGTTTERMTDYITNRKATYMNRSNDVFILADSSKFGQVSAVTFAKLKGKCIITNKLDNDLYRKYAVVKEAK